MRYLIFGSTQERGIEKLEELVGELKYKEVKIFHKSLTSAFAELYDGSIYKVVSVSDSLRGIKADKAYVDYEVSADIIGTVICQCLVVSALPEGERIETF